MKRFILLSLIAVVAMHVHAYDFLVDGIYYELTPANEACVVAGDQPYEHYFTIPDEVSYNDVSYRVTAIGDNAFRDCATVVGVNLPAGLRTIGNGAFAGCSMMGTVQFPETLESIGEAAFYGCSSLYVIKIPAAVQTIGAEAFSRCDRLYDFYVADDNAHFSAVGGVLMNKEGTCLLAFPNLHDEYYVVPSGVTEIGSWAFLNCWYLQTITLPEGLKTIGNAAFHGCSSIETVTIPNSVEKLGVWAFSECSQLRTVTMGTQLAEVGEGAFSFCPALQYFRVPAANNALVAVDDVLLSKDERTLVAFPGSKGGTYRIPSTVETIGGQAFYGCNALESVTLPNGLSELGESPFIFCDNLAEILVGTDHPDLTSRSGVLLNKEQTSIVFFPNAKSGSYTIPDGVTDLQCGPFVRSSRLTSLTIPNGVNSIGNWTFMDCDGLLSVSLPSTLNSLGDRAFDCSSLRTVICGSMPMQTTAFATANRMWTTLYMPKGSEDSFLNTDGWQVFGTYRVFGLFVKDQTLDAGEPEDLQVYSAGPLHLSQYQVDIQLPEVMDVQEQADGSCPVVLPEQVTGTAQCVKTGEQCYRITVKCDDQRTLEGEADLLFSLPVYVRKDARDGVYDLLCKHVSFFFQDAVHEGSATQPELTAGINIVNTTGISVLHADQTGAPVYNLQGQCVRQAGEPLQGLPAGIYVVHGKKVLLNR